jgi:hypothetical protein
MEANSKDPYVAGGLPERWDSPHSSLEAAFVCILKPALENRGLRLILNQSRGIRRYDVHELILTDEDDAAPGGEVNRIAYIGFVEFSTGGLLVAGQTVAVNGESIGEIAGFDETHMPNHQNIVLMGRPRVSGYERGYRLGDKVTFIPLCGED